VAFCLRENKQAASAKRLFGRQPGFAVSNIVSPAEATNDVSRTDDVAEKWQLSMVLIEVIFCYNSAKYEANFVILFRLLLQTI